MAVSPSAFAAFGDQQFLSMFQHIGQQFASFTIEHFCSAGNLDVIVFAVAAMELFSLSMSSVLCLLVRCVENADEGGDIFIGNQDYVSTPGAVTSVRPTFGNELFPAKAHTAVTTVSCLSVESGCIDE